MTDPVLSYHERSKHRLDRYAPGPGELDWGSQPDPFRSFSGAPEIALPLLAGELPVCWDDMFASPGAPTRALDVETIACLLQLSMGLSAWKSCGGARWALRCNPSSGNLHPTEAYLICPKLPGLAAGVYHYRPDAHRLERRTAAPFAWADGVLLALTGIHWREAWKYGVRAFRYCQHDCGHALAALSYAAASLGWQLRLLTAWSDEEIASLTGVARSEDFPEAELEAPECLVWIGPGAAPAANDVLASLESAAWLGRANALSRYHRDWPEISAVAAAISKAGDVHTPAFPKSSLPALLPMSREPVSQLIRQRRSAQAFDGITSISAQNFYRMLDALLPRSGQPPWSLLEVEPSVHPVLFVHRVDGLEPGIYCLPRSPAALEELRAAMRPDWLWAKPAGCQQHLPLYLLAPIDVRQFASTASCHQDIAADSAFALAMLARFDDIGSAQPWRYRLRFWEAGMLGQVLYLEAEAAGVQGTGIGCYFDDSVHDALGLDTTRFQDVYHFTVGKALLDTRVAVEAAYAHLD